MGCGVAKPSLSEAAVLAIGELLHDADSAFPTNKVHAFQCVFEAHQQLSFVERESYDHYEILVCHREGKLHFSNHDLPRAVEAYTKAIQVAEVQIAQKRRGLYLMLQRYAECMVDMSRIWHVAAERATSDKKRQKEFSKCEMVLLRCIETVEEGHNRRSDLLIAPIMMLVGLYEQLSLVGRAEMLLRRCQGIYIVNFGHDDPNLIVTNRKLEELMMKRDALQIQKVAVKLQSVFRMHKAMKRVGLMLHKKLARHELVPPAQRRKEMTDEGFLEQLCSELQEGSVNVGHNSEQELMDNHPIPQARNGNRVKRTNTLRAVPTSGEDDSRKPWQIPTVDEGQD